MTRNWADPIMIFLVAALSVSASSSPSENAGNIVNYLQEGNDALAAGDFQAAIRSYEACLALDPDERYCNINYASSLVDEWNESEEDGNAKRERTARAMSALRHVLSLHPRDGDAAFNLALLLQDSSRSEETTRESASLYQIAVEAMEMDPDEGD